MAAADSAKSSGNSRKKPLYGQSELHSSCPNGSTHQKSLGFGLLSRRKGDTLVEEFSKLVVFKQGDSTWGLCSLQSFCKLCFCELWVVSIPMRNSTDSKCNGKCKQYFKDIGDSETLSWFSSPFSHAFHSTLACRWHEFDYPSYSTTQWKTAAPMQKQISMKSESWQRFLRNSL